MNLLKNIRFGFMLAVVSIATNLPAFEQVHRMNNLTLQFTTDSFATNNAFGGAFTSVGQPGMQQSISNRVASGQLSVLLAFGGLDDFTGVTDPSLQLGIVNTVPWLPPGNPANYSGISDLDWWYAAIDGELDPQGLPVQQWAASLSSRTLNTGISNYFIFGTNQLFAGGRFAMSSATLLATTTNSSAPLKSTNSFPPGHLLSENVPAALVSFELMTNGQLRGNVSAESLATTPVPPAWMTAQYSPAYNANNSLLDVLIGGLRAVLQPVQIPVINPTQPDKFDPNVPPAGAGATYTFSADPNTRKVTTCRDKNGAIVPLADALKAAAYSTYFKFTTDRVILLRQPSIAPTLISQPLTNQQFHFVFTNASDLPFTVLATTNLTLPMTNWAVLGSPTQSATGFYEFIDPNSLAQPHRTYRVRSP